MSISSDKPKFRVHKPTGGVIMPDPKDQSKEILFFPEGMRPGVFLNGKELARKETIFGCENDPTRRHPREDVRAKGYGAR